MEGVCKKNEGFDELAKEMFLPSLHMPVALLWRVTLKYRTAYCAKEGQKKTLNYFFL